MIWAVLILLMLALTAAGFLYLLSRLRRFRLIGRRFSGRGGTLLGTAVLLGVFLLLCLSMGIWNAPIVLLHLILFWLLCDGIAWVVGRIGKKCGRQRKTQFYAAGLAAVLLTAGYLGVGYYYAHHVFRTEYRLTTEDTLPGGRLKIVGFSDAHVGTTFSGDALRDYLERMNRENADIAVIVGDFVDDSTSYDDMKAACAALGELKTAYGVYYVFGNHDAGYRSSDVRGFGREDLINELRANGVTVLQDETVLLGSSVSVTGRQDKQVYTRMDMEALSSGIPAEHYHIVLDHQPNDYAAEAGAGADLVLSGHTHGGQLLPVLRAGEWLGMNDFTYGQTRRQDTDFIVSSGIGDWEILFRTGCIAEYFVVDVEQTQKQQ